MSQFLIHNAMEKIAKEYVNLICQKIELHKFEITGDNRHIDKVILSFTLDNIKLSISKFFEETGSLIDYHTSSLQQAVLKDINETYNKIKLIKLNI